jgi:hypothetical protein
MILSLLPIVYVDCGEYICTFGNGIADRDGNVKQTVSGYVIINGM